MAMPHAQRRCGRGPLKSILKKCIARPDLDCRAASPPIGIVRAVCGTGRRQSSPYETKRTSSFSMQSKSQARISSPAELNIR
eukprot:6188036-Pleurochrysis_carterae.AAC.1